MHSSSCAARRDLAHPGFLTLDEDAKVPVQRHMLGVALGQGAELGELQVLATLPPPVSVETAVEPVVRGGTSLL